MSKNLLIIICGIVLVVVLFVNKDRLLNLNASADGANSDNVGNAETIPADHFTDQELADEVLNSEQVVILDFTATWCPPCQKLKPILHDIENSKLAKVIEIDVDHNQAMASKFGASAIPHLVFVKNGKLVKTATGFRTKKALTSIINEVDQ